MKLPLNSANQQTQIVIKINSWSVFKIKMQAAYFTYNLQTDIVVYRNSCAVKKKVGKGRERYERNEGRTLQGMR